MRNARGVTLSHRRIRPLPFVLPDQRNFKINDFVIFKFILNKKNCYEELNFKRMSANLPLNNLLMSFVMATGCICFHESNQADYPGNRINFKSFFHEY